MALALFPLPKPLAADLPRLREQPLPHPILDRALARADVLGERREILKRRRGGGRHGGYSDLWLCGGIERIARGASAGLLWLGEMGMGPVERRLGAVASVSATAARPCNSQIRPVSS